MKVGLTGFSQEVDFENPKQVNYFLLFKTEAGKEIKLPSSAKAAEVLIEEMYGDQQKEEPQFDQKEAEEELPEVSEVFGGDYRPGQDEDEPERKEKPEPPPPTQKVAGPPEDPDLVGDFPDLEVRPRQAKNNVPVRRMPTVPVPAARKPLRAIGDDGIPSI